MKTPEMVRLQAGFDHTRLAALAGVSTPTIGRIERGETRCLRPLTLQKIGSVLVNRLKKENIDFTVEQYIEMCVNVRDARMRSEGRSWFRRTA